MSDFQARMEAVQTQRSVIVQAPAGSGKTTLLVERYLGLLAVVEAPEEILAVTFTRKAAAEMRQRVLCYLDPEFQPTQAHEQGPAGKARAVADKVAAWRLRENPQRMLIRTIDSFNHYLARSMPVASALGPVPAPADNAKALYRRAARNVLLLMEHGHDLAADLERLLDWRDHRSQDIENLLAGLLGQRDQWLRALSITGTPQRTQLESVLSAVITHQLGETEHIFRKALDAAGLKEDDVIALLQFSAGNLAAEDRHSPIRQFSGVDRLPGSEPVDLPLWAALAEALLTKQKNGQFRKSVSIATGFPPKTPEKDQFQAMLDVLSANQPLCKALHGARHLPNPTYTDEEWSVLDALVRVLHRCAAELELVFARSGQTDYAGLAAAAQRGLGDEQRGFTDLGLYLDRRIRHILVDEFQDTNWSQLHLLEKLTAGWEKGDGRSLFLVGDPMQSIYRFREAEVGLFIRSREQGIGGLNLESRQLSLNFRSRSEIVNWVNDRLGPIFPSTENIAAGAVAYAPSKAGRNTGGRVDILAQSSPTQEAEAIAELAARAVAEQSDNPDFKAAIIVRGRSHLRDILPALARHQLLYRAVKLDPLTSRSTVQDLLALTRAILQPADTTAVLALLRSPVCGLTLGDLYALAGDGRSLHAPQALHQLNTQARQRAERVLTALRDARGHWQRRPIRDLVEGVWHRLGGPACCTRPETDLRDAEVYLDTLQQAASSGLLADWNDFMESLEDAHTEGDPPSEDVKLEILTMHAAKGLEWDLVILPALHKRPTANDTVLLHWLPFTSSSDKEQMLLAPLRASDQAVNSPLVELIRREQQARAAFENQRLLYVAATRARERLVLSAVLDPEKDDIKPASGSLLADLWTTCAADFVEALNPSAANDDASSEESETTARPDQFLRRINIGWQPPCGERAGWQPTLQPREQELEIEYNWAGVQARRMGTVLHRLLERAGNIGIENLGIEQQSHLKDKIPQLFKAMGSRGDQLNEAVEIVTQAFEATLESETGRWILSKRHSEAACELPVAGLIDGQLVNAVIDRTFVDDQNQRWIIDYKSGYHAGADLNIFLAEERERYRDQLNRYRRLFEQLENRTIKTALYLPRHGKLQIVEPDTPWV